MIDNLRFMHGREKIINRNRDIVNIQTKIARFGFGATIRILKNQKNKIFYC